MNNSTEPKNYLLVKALFIFLIIIIVNITLIGCGKTTKTNAQIWFERTYINSTNDNVAEIFLTVHTLSDMGDEVPVPKYPCSPSKVQLYINEVPIHSYAEELGTIYFRLYYRYNFIGSEEYTITRIIPNVESVTDTIRVPAKVILIDVQLNEDDKYIISWEFTDIHDNEAGISIRGVYLDNDEQFYFFKDIQQDERYIVLPYSGVQIKRIIFQQKISLFTRNDEYFLIRDDIRKTK